MLGKEKARADSVEKDRDAHKTRADKAEAARDDLKEKFDAAEKARKDAVDATPAKVRARVDLETKAGPIMGKDFKMDALEDRAIQVAVIKHVTGVEVAADRSNDYVAARFDAAVERAGTSTEVFQRAHAEIEKNRAAKTDADDLGEKAKAENAKRGQNLFIPVGGHQATK